MSEQATSIHGLSRTERPDAAVDVTAPASRWKTRVMLPGVIVVTILLLLLYTAAETFLPATPVRVVPVVVKTVEGATGTVVVQAPGWLEPDPHPYFVAALADGVVREVLVLEGAKIEANQVVARLVDDDARLALRRAEAELLSARSDVEGANADRTAARQQLEHLIERERALAVASARVEEMRSEIERVHADVAIERARLAELEDEYDRKSKLTESQAISEAIVARLRHKVDGQQATVDAAVARAAVVEARLLQANAERSAETANRNLLIEERQAEALAAAEVTRAEASVVLRSAARDEAALRLDRMEVRSPVAGIVMRRLASPGSQLTRGGTEHSSHVVHVYDPLHLQVRVDVPLADAAHVSVGQKAEVIVEVLPDRIFTGRITRVVHEADIQKNTVEVKVALDDPSEELKPEMLARAKFLATAAPTPDGSVRQRIFAPQTLLRAGGDGGMTALVVTGLSDGRGRAERRVIKTGSRAIDGWTEIETGLQVGDLLIVDPPADLESGDRVRVIGEQAAGPRAGRSDGAELAGLARRG